MNHPLALKLILRHKQVSSISQRAFFQCTRLLTDGNSVFIPLSFFSLFYMKKSILQLFFAENIFNGKNYEKKNLIRLEIGKHCE